MGYDIAEPGHVRILQYQDRRDIAELLRPNDTNELFAHNGEAPARALQHILVTAKSSVKMGDRVDHTLR